MLDCGTSRKIVEDEPLLTKLARWLVEIVELSEIKEVLLVERREGAGLGGFWVVLDFKRGLWRLADAENRFDTMTERQLLNSRYRGDKYLCGLNEHG